MILEQIAMHKRCEVLCMKERLSGNPFNGNLGKSKRSFLNAIKGRKKISLIAEIKRASPSAGIINQNLDIKKTVSAYDKYADAISAVTDERFFAGHPSLVKSAKLYSSKPVLRKDFIVDEIQVRESRAIGADAILLIASLLSRPEIENFIELASGYEMDSLVEVRCKEEVEKAVSAGAKIIGVNNRDLTNFKIDLSTTEKLLESIPSGAVIVSESGFHTAEDIRAYSGKIDAVLAGTVLMKSGNIEEKLKELSGNG